MKLNITHRALFFLFGLVDNWLNAGYGEWVTIGDCPGYHKLRILSKFDQTPNNRF